VTSLSDPHGHRPQADHLAEIKSRASINEVWAALGGARLRGNRGQAFWRDGDGFNISLDFGKGVWYDFATHEGGDVFSLVETALGCDFRGALRWLANFSGMDISEPARCARSVDTDWPNDLRWARWWKIAAETMAEWALEEPPYCHPERRGLTSLLNTIRLGDQTLVNEYREWRRRDPELTTAMCLAGRNSDARLERKLARFLVRFSDGG
jgi:hypothetical protein